MENEVNKKTQAVPPQQSVVQRRGTERPQNPDCSAVPIFICPECKFANVLTASLKICFACAWLETMANRDEEDSDA